MLMCTVLVYLTVLFAELAYAAYILAGWVVAMAYGSNFQKSLALYTALSGGVNSLWR